MTPVKEHITGCPVSCGLTLQYSCSWAVPDWWISYFISAASAFQPNALPGSRVQFCFVWFQGSDWCRSLLLSHCHHDDHDDSVCVEVEYEEDLMHDQSSLESHRSSFSVACSVHWMSPFMLSGHNIILWVWLFFIYEDVCIDNNKKKQRERELLCGKAFQISSTRFPVCPHSVLSLFCNCW